MTPPAHKLPAAAKTVLVIDDDAALLDLLAVTLQQEGLVAVTATNGKEGLEKARSLAPDLILLDVVLPEMDGLTVCSHLRRSRATAGIPIIMLTGLTSTANRAASLDCGADEYITKPFDPARLLSRIQDLLGQAQGTVVGATH